MFCVGTALGRSSPDRELGLAGLVPEHKPSVAPGHAPLPSAARLLRRLMQDLPQQIKAAEEATRRTIEDGLDS